MELTGDSGDMEDQETFSTADVIVTTPEKCDAFTRKFPINCESLLQKVELLLIDEVHLLNTEERGATLEAVVSRFKLISSKRKSKLRIIALSATIPNIVDIAQWLDATHNTKFFGEEHRPVPLEKHVLGYNRSKSEFLFEKALNYRLIEILRKYSDKKPSLVFCQTQKGTISACEQLLSDSHEREFISNDHHLKLLLDYSSQVTDPHLRRFLLSGLGFHNSRLKPEDRRLVERLFKEKLLQVICTTSTLAQGVNLPARLVVIKSTMCYRGSGIGYSDYSQLEIEQMMGRAGRPQYDSKGVVVIMTQREKVELYQRKIAMKEELESHFSKKLAENLNAEVALGSVRDLDSAVEYIKSTFFYVRAKKNPKFYGILDQNTNFEQQIIALCKTFLKDMQQYDLLSLEERSGLVKPLELGKEMARFYVEFPTIKKLFSEFNNSNLGDIQEILRVLAQAQEFERFRSKMEERNKLRTLNDRNRFKIKGAISTADKKAFVLLQTLINRENLEDWELIRDSNEISNFTWRILSCFKRYFVKKKQAKNLISTIKLNKYIISKTWEDNPATLLRQIPGIGEKLARSLLENQINSLEKLSQCSKALIEAFCGKHPPFGENTKNFLCSIPSIEIQTKQKTNRTLTFEIINSNKDLHENYAIIYMIFYNSSNTVFFYKFLDMRKQGYNNIQFDIHLNNDCSKQLPLNIAVLNDRFVGLDKHFLLNKDLQLKESKYSNLIEETEINLVVTEEKNFKKTEKNENLKLKSKLKKEETAKFYENYDNDVVNESHELAEEEMVDELLNNFLCKDLKSSKVNDGIMDKENYDIIIKPKFNNNKKEINLKNDDNFKNVMLNSKIQYKKDNTHDKEIKNSMLTNIDGEETVEFNKNTSFAHTNNNEKTVNFEKKKTLENTLKWYQEKNNHQDFYSLFSDIF